MVFYHYPGLSETQIACSVCIRLLCSSVNHKIEKYSPIMTRIEKKKIEDMITETKNNNQ